MFQSEAGSYRLLSDKAVCVTVAAVDGGLIVVTIEGPVVQSEEVTGEADAILRTVSIDAPPR